MRKSLDIAYHSFAIRMVFAWYSLGICLAFAWHSFGIRFIPFVYHLQSTCNSFTIHLPSACNSTLANIERHPKAPTQSCHPAIRMPEESSEKTVSATCRTLRSFCNLKIPDRRGSGHRSKDSLVKRSPTIPQAWRFQKISLNSNR